MTKEEIMDKLVFDYNQIKDKKLSECSIDELKILMAYNQWCDGAEFCTIIDILENAKSNIAYMKDFLNSVYPIAK